MAKRPIARKIEFEITNMIDDIMAEDGDHKFVMVDGKIDMPMNDPAKAAQIEALQRIKKFVKGE